MLLIKTKLLPSPIHGLGVFAEDFIPEGTAVWKLVPGFDLLLTVDEMEQLPVHVQEWISRYGFLNLDIRRWIICVDDARFMNHSQEPNTVITSLGLDSVNLAKRDIQAGEEITDDYRYYAWEPPS